VRSPFAVLVELMDSHTAKSVVRSSK